MSSGPATHRDEARASSGFYWLLLCCGVLVLVMAWPAIQGKIYVLDDLWGAHYPMRLFYSNCLRDGDSFTWMPDAFCGFYLVGWGEVGTHHPLKWMLYRCLDWPTSFNVDLLWSYPFMLLGMFFFLRRHLDRVDACLYGAMTLAFSGFSLLHFVHPTAMSVISHYPWLFLAMNVTVTGKTSSSRIQAEVSIAVLTASQLLLGYPQYVWIGLVGQAFYMIYLIGNGDAKIGGLIRIIVPLLIGLTIGCAQVIPTWDALSDSTRTSLDPDFAVTGSAHPLNLVQLAAPSLFETRVVGQNTHELGIHFGAIPLILVLWLSTSGISTMPSQRWLIIVFALMAGVALLLMFGKYGGLYYLQTWLPVVGKFRFPARYGVLLQLAIAVLAAIAYYRLASADDSSARKRLLIIGVTLVGASLLSSILFSFALDAKFLSPLWLRVAGVLSLVVAAMVFLIRGRCFWPVLILVTAVDLGVYGMSYFLPHVKTEQQALSEIPVPPDSPPAGSDDRVLVENQFLVLGEDRYFGNSLIAAGWKQADGYMGLIPRIDVLGPNVSQESLRVAGVHWVMDRGQNSSIDGLQRANEIWLRNDDPLQRARLVGQTQFTEDVVKTLPTIDPKTTALLDRPLPMNSDEIGTVRIVVDRPGRMELEIAAAQPQLLVISERFHPGWKFTVDGYHRDTDRVYQDFLGCVVAAGESKVSVVFEPHSLYTGMRVSLIGLVTLAIWIFIRSRLETLVQNHTPTPQVAE